MEVTSIFPTKQIFITYELQVILDLFMLGN